VEIHLKMAAKKRPEETGGAESSAARESAEAASVAVAEALLRPAGPRIKTYVAASVSHAMDMARRELGEDAMLIQSKRSESAAGQFEVTFGIVPGSMPVTAASIGEPRTPAQSVFEPPRQTQAQPSPRKETKARAAEETGVASALDSLRREVLAMQTILVRTKLGSPACTVASTQVARLYTMLMQQGVDPELVAELVGAVQDRLSAPHPEPRGEADDPTAARDGLHAHFNSRIRSGESLEPGKAVMLVGPPATGKTSALIKIAMEHGLKRGLRPEIFTLDRSRRPGSRALETMTELMDIRCRPLLSLEALRSALSSPRDEDTMMLIDTSGYGDGAIEKDMELAAALQASRDLEVHLVLPATWHAAALRRAVDRFEPLEPSRILFTMLDQAAVFGPLVQETWRAGKTLSFFTTGSTGPASIQRATIEDLIARMWDSTEGAAG
jgi:flagellar biosynthesis protein FlhF